MSYAAATASRCGPIRGGVQQCAVALGTLEPWEYPSLHTLDDQEVYVLRLGMNGVVPRDRKDVLAFVQALGRSKVAPFDLRGAALFVAIAMDQMDLDLVMTSKSWQMQLPFMAATAEDMANALRKDPSLRELFPSMQIATSVFGELTGPPQAIDHWRSQPLLWDTSLGDGGGPTDTFASPAAYSVVAGQADDGKEAVPWKPSSSEGLGPSGGKSGDASTTTLLFVGGAVALAIAIGLRR